MPRFENYKELMREDLHILAMSSEDIVEGFDFKDEELLSVLGSKKTKTDTEIY
jgi:hypothetical protein